MPRKMETLKKLVICICMYCISFCDNQGNIEKKLTKNRRAAAVYRIARFPINYATGENAEAWKRGQNAYLKGGQ